MTDPRRQFDIEFDQLTDDQLNALDFDAMEFYIDLACAAEGIPLLPPQPEPPPERTITKSVQHYVIAGLKFSNRDAAEAIAAEINKHHEHRRETKFVGGGYSNWNNPQYDVRDETPEVSVTVERAFSHQEAEAQLQDKERHAAARKQYETDKKFYDTTQDKRSRVAADIRSRVSEAQTKVSRRERLKREYARYLDLAGGNPDTAARFLYHTYHDADITGIPNPGAVVAEAPAPEPAERDPEL